jgi:hypothetical protein
MNINYIEDNSKLFVYKPVVVEKAFSKEECDIVLTSIRNSKKELFQIPKYRLYENSLYYSDDLNMSEVVQAFILKASQIIFTANQNCFNFIIEELRNPIFLELSKGFFVKEKIELKANDLENKKLIFFITLSENNAYKGGKFNFKFDQDLSYNEQGSLILFPSYMFYDIEPILEGVKFLIYGYVNGPSFI